LALKSGELRLEAITTVSGNVHVDKCTKNALKILELMDRKDIPVARGAAKPLKRKLYTAEHIHGKDGLGESNLPEPKIKTVNEDAANLIIKKATENPGSIILVPVGPLTNIALAIKREPQIKEKVKEIVLMGGAYGVTPYGYGNVTPVAEFNIFTDPEAAKIVFDSGIKITAIGLDVTTNPKALLTQGDLEKIKGADTKAAKIVIRITKRIMDLYEKYMGFRAMAVHDAMAVSYLISPDLFTVEKYRVEIETKGEFTTGQTVTDRRPQMLRDPSKKPNVYVCTNVEGRKFINFFVNRIRE